MLDTFNTQSHETICILFVFQTHVFFSQFKYFSKCKHFDFDIIQLHVYYRDVIKIQIFTISYDPILHSF